MIALPKLVQKFELLWPLLDERTRRIMAANESHEFGFRRSFRGSSRQWIVTTRYRQSLGAHVF